MDTAKAAPAKAAHVFTRSDAEGNRTADSATKNPAPALIPRRPASDRGFLVIPCITAPERAKAIPVRQAASALGIRISSMISPMPDALAGYITVSAKTLKPPPAMPVQTERIIEKPSSITKATRVIRNAGTERLYLLRT